MHHLCHSVRVRPFSPHSHTPRCPIATAPQISNTRKYLPHVCISSSLTPSGLADMRRCIGVVVIIARRAFRPLLLRSSRRLKLLQHIPCLHAHRRRAARSPGSWLGPGPCICVVVILCRCAELCVFVQHIPCSHAPTDTARRCSGLPRVTRNAVWICGQVGSPHSARGLPTPTKPLPVTTATRIANTLKVSSTCAVVLSVLFDVLYCSTAVVV